MREVPGEPQQLELEREPERLQLRPGARRSVVKQIEEPRQRPERAVVGLLLGEETQHRLRADQPDRETVRVLPRCPVGVDELHARDRVQLAAPLVQEDLDVAERLQPPAEA